MEGQVFFSGIREQIILNLKSAKNKIVVAVAWITDTVILNELLLKASEGVFIEILIYNDKINDVNLFKGIYKYNASIYLSKKMMHNKFCVIDDKIVLNGSFNWTKNANTNSENLQVIHSELLAKQFLSEFSELKKGTINASTVFKNAEKEKIELNELEEFLIFYQKNYGKYDFPFFYDARNLTVETPIGAKDYIYLIKNLESAKNVIYYFYKKMNIEKSFKSVRNEGSFFSSKLRPSQYRITHIFNASPDLNNVILYHENIRVVAKLYDYRIYCTKIKSDFTLDRDVLIEVTDKLNKDQYLFLDYENSVNNYKVDSSFKITKLELNVDRVFGLYNNFILFKKNNLFGLYDIDGKLILPPFTDKYPKKIDDKYVEFTENPIFRLVKTDNRKMYYIFYEEKYGEKNEKKYLFNISTGLMEDNSPYNSAIFKNLIYLSEENFKYYKLYNYILSSYFMIFFMNSIFIFNK